MNFSRLIPLITLSLFPLLSPAQEDAVQAESKPEATLTSDLKIPVDDLEIKLEPLIVAELETEASAWQELVKEAATEVAEAAIASRAEPEGSAGKGRALEKIGIAQTKAQDRVDRINAVLDAWGAKGGDPSELRLYAKAVSGTKIDVTDAPATAKAVGDWATSKDGGIKWAKKLGIFALIMIGFWLASGIITKVVSKAMDKHEASSELIDTFVKKSSAES